jgi:hypothetical protein
MEHSYVVRQAPVRSRPKRSTVDRGVDEEAAANEGRGDGLDDNKAVDLAEQAADALTEVLPARFGVLDVEAVADENSF